jgi:DNA-binding IclR family transcriptional regulator
MARVSPPTERVIATVSMLAAHPGEPMTLAELTRRLGVNKSTGHAILTSLAGAGWVLRDPVRKTYRLGPALVAVGRTAADSFPALDFARPVMAELSLEFDAACAALGVGESEITVLDQVGDLRHGRTTGFRVGAVFPLRPPLGAAVLAWADDSVRDDWLVQVPAETRGYYRDALAVTHERGYAVEIWSTPVARVRELVMLLGDDASTGPVLERLADELAAHEEFLAVALEPDGEYAVNVVNAPVFDHTGQVTVVLSLTGFGRPLRGHEVLAVGARLVETTAKLTEALAPPAPTRGRG